MVKLIGDEEAGEKVGAIFEEVRSQFGMVPNFFRAQAGADPAWLELNWNRWKAIMGKEGALDRKTKELIALTVSIINQCGYCVAAHEAMALQVGASEEDILEMKEVIELFQSFNSIADSLEVPSEGWK